MGSGALSGKMLLVVGIIEKIILIIILGEVRLALPHRVRNRIMIRTAGLEPPAGARYMKKYLSKLFSIILEARYSILQGSTPDPKNVKIRRACHLSSLQ